MGLRTEEECTALVGSGRDDDDATTVVGGLVDDGLDSFCLNEVAVVFHAIIRDDILLSERVNIHLLGVAEPSIHLSAIGPKFSLGLLDFLLFLCGFRACWHQSQQACHQKNIFSHDSFCFLMKG